MQFCVNSGVSNGTQPPVSVHHIHYLPPSGHGQLPPQNRGRSRRQVSNSNIVEHNMKWFGSKLSDGGPQLLSLSPLSLDEDDTVFFPPSAPSTPSQVKRRTRGRSKQTFQLNIFPELFNYFLFSSFTKTMWC